MFSYICRDPVGKEFTICVSSLSPKEEVTSKMQSHPEKQSRRRTYTMHACMSTHFYSHLVITSISGPTRLLPCRPLSSSHAHSMQLLYDLRYTYIYTYGVCTYARRLSRFSNFVNVSG
jgi:hypothetical protein